MSKKFVHSTDKEGKSLSEVNQSVDTTRTGKSWRRVFAFMGPAYMISVGYMDPGNWATDIAGGSQFGYSLLWVLLMSNLIALLLQSHCARLGVVSGKDLAQASREYYPGFVNIFLYILAEIAIAACDLAEVVGMAIGLQLLFDIPLVWGVIITVLDTFLLLFLLNFGIKKLEAFIICLVAIIGMAFGAEMIFAKPDISEIAGGLIPYLKNEDALYIAIGIIGATVMPHNLYLHSSLVQTRKFEKTDSEIKKAIRFNIIDSSIALNLALFVNAAILILAASSFFNNGMYEVSEIQDAHKFLQPMLGTQLAPILFAVALIAAGQSSTITGTLAGQIVMEGYLNLRIQPWMRRLLTRIIAIGPALFAIIYFGESSTGKLLVLSQVVLSLQLGFAIIPLIHLVSNKSLMGKFSIGTITKIASWIAATIIIGLNIKLVLEQIQNWIGAAENPIILYCTVVPLAIFSGIMLFYIALKPLFVPFVSEDVYKAHGDVKMPEIVLPAQHNHIAITVDFSTSDDKAISKAIQLGGKDCYYILIHVVESPNAFIYGKETRDAESLTDKTNLENYALKLTELGYKAEIKLGYGNPKKAIPEIVSECGAELLVMGSHGHKGLMDLIFGTTMESVRHKIKVPLLIV